MGLSISHRPRAFSLIELLIVVVIIGLLSGIATTSYVRAQKNARDDARKADLNAIVAAANTYYSVKKEFPGKIDISEVPTTNRVAYTRGDYTNCETIKSPGSNSFVYYYAPASVVETGGAKPCGERAAIPGVYDPGSFKPAGTWIPGLSPYLSPLPIEKHYLGSSGGVTSPYATDLLSNGTAQTYAYRHLKGGFVVYTRLEGSGGSSVTSVPGIPGATGANLYLIQQ